MVLVGGSGPFEGKLFATNPVTKTFGPVCDDYFDINAVSLGLKCQIKPLAFTTMIICHGSNCKPFLTTAHYLGHLKSIYKC